MSMKKKLWCAVSVAAVCFTVIGSVSAFGKNVDIVSHFRSHTKSAVVDSAESKTVSKADQEDEEVIVVDSSMAGSYINETQGDGYKINEDGTFTAYKDFKNKKGKMIGTVLPEGSQWIFSSPVMDNGQVIGTYKDGEWVIDGKTYTYTFGGLSLPSLHFYDIYVNNKSLVLWGKKMKKLEEKGLKCTADLDQKIKSLEVTDEITVTSGKAVAKVRAINPYENEAPLSDCLICSFYSDDTTGTFGFESDGFKCGDDCYDNLLQSSVYIYEKDRLVYKDYIFTLSDVEYHSGDDSRGEKILNVTGDVDITFCFDGSILKSFSFTDPKLLYKGLNDNVAGADFESMSEEEKGQVLKVRGDILTRLKAAFEDAGIEVNIDDTTGEIIMDAKVLFDVDSYEISDEGKKYLDQFVKVYVPVLFSNEFKDSIDQVHFDGHTDSRGSFGHNAELSDKRARAVLDYCLESTANGLTAEEKELLSQKGVTEGHASTNLIYDEEGHEDSEASRRVTVKFFIKVN